jgi:hypothetical protein
MKTIDKDDVGKKSGAVYVQLREGLVKSGHCGYYGRTTSFTVYDTTLEKLEKVLLEAVRRTEKK